MWCKQCSARAKPLCELRNVQAESFYSATVCRCLDDSHGMRKPQHT